MHLEFWVSSSKSNSFRCTDRYPLADEMGPGKVCACSIIFVYPLTWSGQTLQTIAFSAYLIEQQHSRPFLVVCPLSVLHNWVEEYAKFAPSVRPSFFFRYTPTHKAIQIPVVMYHGDRNKRAELRRTGMRLEDKEEDANKAARKPKLKSSRKARGRQR